MLDPAEARERDERMLRHRGDPNLALPQLPAAAFTRGIVDADGGGTAVAPAGTLVPQYFVTDPEHPEPTRFDDVVGAGALLVTRVGAEGLSVELRDALARVGGRIVEVLPKGTEATGGSLIDRSVVDTDGSYTAEVDRIGAVAYLARPDGYYFGAAPSAAGIAALVAEFVAEVTEPNTAPASTR